MMLLTLKLIPSTMECTHIDLKSFTQLCPVIISFLMLGAIECLLEKQ